MSRYFSDTAVEKSRLRFACRKVTDKIVRAWIEALDAELPDGGPDHEVRIKAANALADRGYGKPAQEVIVTPDGESLHGRIQSILAAAGIEDDAESTGEAH